MADWASRRRTAEVRAAVVPSPRSFGERVRVRGGGPTDGASCRPSPRPSPHTLRYGERGRAGTPRCLRWVTGCQSPRAPFGRATSGCGHAPPRYARRQGGRVTKTAPGMKRALAVTLSPKVLSGATCPLRYTCSGVNRGSRHCTEPSAIRPTGLIAAPLPTSGETGALAAVASGPHRRNSPAPPCHQIKRGAPWSAPPRTRPNSARPARSRRDGPCLPATSCSRRSAGCGCRPPSAPRSRSHRRCGRPVSRRTRRRARTRHPPPPGAR